MFVRRESECAQLDRLVAEARRGAGGALVVRGAPGIGKSALLSYARGAAPGMRVLSASGVESESELGFAALGVLLRPLLRYLGELVPVQRAALERALGLRSAGPSDRFGVAVATLSLLARAAEDSPVLVLVDDAHWLDVASADALLFAARRLGGDRAAMLFAAREGERSSFEAAGLSELWLDGLGREDCGRLLAGLLGRRVSPSLIDWLARATGGNPLALVELPSLANEQALAAGELLNVPVPVGRQIRCAFSRRIAALPAEAQRALGWAAISETGAMAEIGAVLDRLGLDRSALAAAEVAGLVRIAGGELEFRHPLLRAVAYHGLSGPDRRVGHLALAEALARDSTRRAWHFAAAVVEPDEQIASELEAAAREAQGRSAPAAAAAALETAARLSLGGEERVRRLIAAAGEFHRAGLRARAVQALNDAGERATDALVTADIERLRARIELLDAPCVDLRTLLVAQADRVCALDARRAAALLIDAALLSVAAGEPRQALALAQRAYPAAEQVGGTLALAASCSLGAGLLLCGQAESARPLLERGEALIEAEDLFAAGYLVVSVAQAQNWQHCHGRARDLLRRVIARARRESVLTVLPTALSALAEAEFQLGDWTAAYAAASEAVSLAEEVGQRTQLADSLARLAQIEAGRGNETACRERARRALDLASRLQAASISSLAASALGLAELGRGRPHDAIAHLQATRRTATDAGAAGLGVATWAADLAEAHARVGESDEANATLALLENQARDARSSSALAAAARVRAILAPDADYCQLFTEALQWHEEAPLPFEVARTQLCYGQRLRRNNRAIEARNVLRTALITFEHLGARRWAQQARQELEASGEQRRFQLNPASELTPQELQVATLVSDGASNREAAAALFISPKTVEVHLTRIYRKLGVRSRTQLARQLRH